MGFWDWYAGNRSKLNLYNMFENFFNSNVRPYGEDLLGYTKYKNTQSSIQTQIDYDQYLKAGYERALADWHKNVPNREIRYPEFSFPGRIRGLDTSIARSGFDYSTASANYYGNLPYRTAGLYGIASRYSRYL